MPAWDASALFSAWEAGEQDRGGARVAALLALCSPEAQREALLELPLGERNLRLLDLARTWEGEVLQALASCPSCGTQVELAIPVAALLTAGARTPQGAFQLNWEGPEVRFRLPTSADLLAAQAVRDPARARQLLIERCLLPPAPEITHALTAALAADLSARDPMAELLTGLECVECAHGWTAALDPLEYLWQRLVERCQALFYEVDALARAYHWSEPQILALSPARRRAYLAMVGA